MENKDKCLACKLFTAPLFFAFGAFFAFKNLEAYRSNRAGIDHVLGRQRFTNAVLVGVPMVFFAFGGHCLYEAYWIFKE